MKNDPSTYEVHCPFCHACHDFQTKREADRLGNKLATAERLRDLGRIRLAGKAKRASNEMRQRIISSL